MTSVESFWVSVLNMHSTYLHGKRERLPNEPEPIRVQPEKPGEPEDTKAVSEAGKQLKNLSCREQTERVCSEKDRGKLSIRRQLTKKRQKPGRRDETASENRSKESVQKRPRKSSRSEGKDGKKPSGAWINAMICVVGQSKKESPDQGYNRSPESGRRKLYSFVFRKSELNIDNS